MVNRVLISLLGQACEPYNVELTSVTSTGFRVTWGCNDPHLSDLQVVYTLTNKDQCNAQDALSMMQQSTEWGEWNRQATSDNDLYTHYCDVSGLYPYSTYTFKVRATKFANTEESMVMTVVTNETGTYKIKSMRKRTQK